MADNQDNVRYAHKTHRIFNEQLLQARKSAPHDVVNSPWMSNEAITQLPAVRREFDQNRDPYLALQMRDLTKTEAQRREEQSGRGSTMVKQDRPRANLNPPKEMAAPSDAAKFRTRWLAEQRSAAMAQGKPDANTERDQPSVSKQQYISPER